MPDPADPPGGVTAGDVDPDSPFARPVTVGTPVVLAVLAGLGTLVAVPLMLSVVLAVIQAGVYSPQAAVRGYIRGLEARDARAALDHADPQYRAGTAWSLAEAVVTAEEYAPPSDLQIDDVQELDGDPDARWVDVSYRIGNRRYEDSVMVAREPRSPWRLVRGWYVVEGLPSLTVESTITSPASVNGVTLDQGIPTTVVLPVGGYTIRTPDGGLAVADPQPAVVTFTGGTVALETTLADDAVARARVAVEDHLDACVQQDVLAPAGCPFGFPRGDQSIPVEWEVTEQPTFDLRLTDDGTVQVDTVSSGAATVSGTFDGEDFTEDQSFDIDGELVETDDGIAFVPY
jgi:hypothetical protein